MTKNKLYQNLISKLTDKKYHCIFLKLPITEILSSSDSQKEYESQLKQITDLSKLIFNSLDENGILWIVTDDLYSNGKLKKISFDVSSILTKSNFLLRNMIIWYNENKEKLPQDLVSCYSTIIFAVKNKNYNFDLDSAREPHIWKDFEWGGGRRSRYNPKGKNPSNLWLKTRSEKGKTLQHIPLTTEKMIERCLLLSNLKNKNALIFSDEKFSNLDELFPKSINWEIIPKINHKIKSISILGKKTTQKNISHDVCNKIINKTSEQMNDLTDESVQLVVTSPPYWGLRDYEVKNQIGYDDSYQEYDNFYINGLLIYCNRYN